MALNTRHQSVELLIETDWFSWCWTGSITYKIAMYHSLPFNPVKWRSIC